MIIDGRSLVRRQIKGKGFIVGRKSNQDSRDIKDPRRSKNEKFWKFWQPFWLGMSGGFKVIFIPNQVAMTTP